MEKPTQTLVELLKHFIESASDFQEIKKELKKIMEAYEAQQNTGLNHREYWLNAVLVGLGRYFDDNIQQWRKEKINNEVQRIVLQAAGECSRNCVNLI